LTVILADTSIWIDHFRAHDPQMRKLLDSGQIVMHPLVVAELALGSLRDRARTLAMLDLLPQVRMAQILEVRQMIEARSLYSRGIGLVDAHLIAAVFLNPPTLLWTRDQRLRTVTRSLGIHAAMA
jgi:predicted nucleic acid-binding protein